MTKSELEFDLLKTQYLSELLCEIDFWVYWQWASVWEVSFPSDSASKTLCRRPPVFPLPRNLPHSTLSSSSHKNALCWAQFFFFLTRMMIAFDRSASQYGILNPSSQCLFLVVIPKVVVINNSPWLSFKINYSKLTFTSYLHFPAYLDFCCWFISSRKLLL